MKKLLTVIFFLFLFTAQAQLTLPPSGDNQKASVTQFVGLVKITVNYSSPDVHGPNGEDRTGKIWGNVVHYGYIDQGYGTSKAAPWRAGANETTTISFSHDVVIDGKPVTAGTYALFLDVEKEGDWFFILNKEAISWGSYFYKPELDVVKAKAQPQPTPYTEWLTYTFENRQKQETTLYLNWENKKVGFTISVPNVNQYYVEKLREELRGTELGFTNESYVAAAQFCLSNKVALEQGLAWATTAIDDSFVGRKTFTTLSTKAQLLQALNKNDEAEIIMSEAIQLPTASVQDVHAYGRTLVAEGKTQKAMEIFKFNFNRAKSADDKFTSNVGMARGYTALGDTKNAIKHWETAIKNIPENNKANLAFYENELKKLKEKK
jgi:tetratricopeptide (TPR) repeat protein